MSGSHYLALASLPGLILVIGAVWVWTGRASRKLLVRFEEAFEKAFSELQPAPTLEVQHFAYPHLFVTFKSELQLASARATGRTAEFTAAIQTICSGQSRWGRSFRAELAIDYGYEGQFDGVLARFAAEESLRKKLFKQ